MWLAQLTRAFPSITSTPSATALTKMRKPFSRDIDRLPDSATEPAFSAGI